MTKVKVAWRCEIFCSMACCQWWCLEITRIGERASVDEYLIRIYLERDSWLEILKCMSDEAVNIIVMVDIVTTTTTTTTTTTMTITISSRQTGGSHERHNIQQMYHFFLRPQLRAPFSNAGYSDTTASAKCLRRFLGSFTKLRKATVSCPSICPPAWNNSAPTRRILIKLDMWAFFFENLSRKLKF